jgi:phosphohistidine swiveling domain-containing protein
VATVIASRWPGLSAAACTGPDFAGAKAARLARAAAAGLPVPASVVVPCTLSAPVLATAAHEAAARGIHDCRLEVMTAGATSLDGLDAAVRPLGPALAVRSSSPLEDDPVLAGAFSSLMGVAPEEVATAVRAVWASAIVHLPVAGESAGASPPGIDSATAGLRMGVLIQPELRPDCAGTAEVLGDGTVEVVAIDGPAGPLLAGWATGVTATVTSGRIITPPADRSCDPGVLVAAAGLAGEAARLLGDTLIEWAWADGRLWLVQCRRPVPRSAAPGAAGLPDNGLPPRQVLLRAARWPGELAERWLLPWAVAGRTPLSALDEWAAAAPPVRDPRACWDAFTRAATELTEQAWGAQPDGGARSAADLAAGLRGGAYLAAAAEPDDGLARRCLAVAARLAAHLRTSQVIKSASEFWALPADLGPILAGQPVLPDAARRARQAALRWEPALYSATMRWGERLNGTGVAPGTGCGPGLSAERAAALAESGAGGLPPRPVIVAGYPLPQYAPLLMDAAALVTRHGNEAAHLVTVARALGVPAVIGCGLPATLGRGPRHYVAVDASSGTVAVHAADREVSG